MRSGSRLGVFILLALCLALFTFQTAWARHPGRLADRLLPSASGDQQDPEEPALQGPALRFDRLSVAQGLLHSVAQAIFQDRQGFMWFGTQGGLIKYDGYQFNVYTHVPGDPGSLSHNEVQTLYEDRDGTLWVGTMAGLDRLDRTTGTFTHYQHAADDRTSLSAGTVLSIYEDVDGTLWVGTANGLNRFDPDSQTFSRYLYTLIVSAIHEDRGGEFWVGTHIGLVRLDPSSGKIELYQFQADDPHSLSSNGVSAIVEDGQGQLWIGTYGAGINRMDRSTQTFTRFQHDPDDPFSLVDDRVTFLLADRAGRLWIGTYSGLDLFVPPVLSPAEGSDRTAGRFQHYTHDINDAHSLSHNLIFSMYEDRAGVLWVGTVDGLNKTNWNAERFALYQRRPDLTVKDSYAPDAADRPVLDEAPMADSLGLSDSTVLSVFQDRAGTVWVGTFGGGLNKLDRSSGKVTVYQHDPTDPTSLSSNEVYAIREDRDGDLWIGTTGGLDRFDAETETFVHYRSFPGYRVHVIAEGRSGDLWLGTYGGLYRLDRATGIASRVLDDADDLSVWSGFVTRVYEDRTGVLWVGTYDRGIGLWDVARDEFTTYRHDPEDPQSLGNGPVSSIFEDPTGTVWIGTWGGGLNRFNRETGTFARYTEQDGLPGDVVRCVLADEDGFLWLGTNRGLSKFDPQTEIFHNYSGRDGLQGGEFTSCFQSDDGEMFFGGLQGLNTFYPRQVQDNPHPPPAVITALNVFNRAVRTDLPADAHVRLSYQDNFISFDFAALDYTAPEENQYAYVMEGLDEDWVYAGTRRHADYPGLKPGDYVFRVKGSNNDGVWNEEGVAIYITITPPIWQTWWFRGIIGLILVGGVVGGYRLRVRSLEARRRELERQVEERTHEIERRRQVAEGLRDVVAVLNSPQPLNEVLAYIVAQAGRVLGSEATVLQRIECQRGVIVIEASVGLPDELRPVEGLPLQPNEAYETMLQRQPFMVRDLQEQHFPTRRPEFLTEPWFLWQTVTRQRYRSFLAVPLLVGDGVYGCIAFYHLKPGVFSEEQLGLAMALADQAALAIENAQLHEQARELAVVEERQRLARDLHDAVTQTLFSTSLLAEALPHIWEQDPDAGRRRLEQMRLATRSALAEMRTLLLELRPGAVVGTDLGDLLRQLGDAITGRAHVTVAVDVQGECALPPDVHVAFYRIAQEALNNLAKHARASHASVSLCCGLPDCGGSVRLSISDDGRGFDPDKVAPNHFGLNIMRERAQAVGARLDIESQVGRGTRVNAVWLQDE